MVSMDTFAAVRILVQKLFEAEDRRLWSAVSSLNQRNKQLSDTKVDGFLYAGRFYLPKDASMRTVGAIAKTPLHRSLVPDMEQYLQDDKLVADDQHFIKQILHTLLKPCRSDQEIRDALPECLVSCLPHLSAMARREETAYTIRDNPRALRQFEKFLPKMEFYSAAKLLY